ncbi:MAG: metal-dependent hydrolase [Caulobacteraceae bacterium]|jgi:predicted metal-dependent hydrolase|nr:metal-dependent hydrolase [Caulobacteraceae bacterium]
MVAPNRQKKAVVADERPPVTITPRDLHFDIGGGRTNNWLGGDVVGTAVFNAFSLTFPEAERLFMDAVREYRPQLTGRLLEDARAFISQEAVHSREHRLVNGLLDRHRYPVDAIEAGIRERMVRVRERGPMAMLSVTIALEHFTALIADLLLGDDRLLAGAPRDVARLWQWHAVEESEHRSVAFDVYAEATRDWTPRQRQKARNRIMRSVTALFVGVITRSAARLLAADGMSPSLARARILWFLFGWPGPFRRCWRHYADWFQADFHPSKHDNRPLLERWRAEFPPGAAHGHAA